MAYPKNSKSALLALAVSGGLWVWQNRDKVSTWLNEQSRQLGNQSGGTSYRKPEVGYTGATQRIGIDQTGTAGATDTKGTDI